MDQNAGSDRKQTLNVHTWDGAQPYSCETRGRISVQGAETAVVDHEWRVLYMSPYNPPTHREEVTYQAIITTIGPLIQTAVLILTSK